VRRGREEQPGVLVVDLVGAIAAVVAELIGERDGVEQFFRPLLGEHLEADPHCTASLTPLAAVGDQPRAYGMRLRISQFTAVSVPRDQRGATP
jgi:hypothetical protein